jgi:hypothetical protein
MGAKLGLPHWGKNTHWGCLRAGRQKYLNPRGEKLHNFYYSSNIIISATSETIRWAGHVACVARNA